MKIFFLIILTFFAGSFSALAAEVPPAFRSTDYPLPRFVSLGADEVHVRTGPGKRFPIKWVFRKQGLPVEIVLEYESWRKIRDQDGAEGWVHTGLLSGARAGLITAHSLVPVRQKPDESARLNAYIEPGAIGALKACRKEWCKMEAAGYAGWIQRKFIWGINEYENFD